MSSLNDLYKKMLVDIYFNGDIVSPRGMIVKEKRNYVVVLNDITDNVITVPRVATNLTYAHTELEWYRAATSRIDWDPLIQRVWAKYSDDGVYVNSAYAHRIFGNHYDFIDQWEWVKNELSKDPDSRRAVINLNTCSDKFKETKDFVCTMFIQAFVRNGKLEWTVVTRSNDVYYGFRNDVYCFTSLQRQMADELGLEYGSYTHIAGSMHMYEKEFKKIERLLRDGVLEKDETIMVPYSTKTLRQFIDGRRHAMEGVMP